MISIPYLNKKSHLEIPEKNLLAVVEPNEFAASGTTEEMVAGALSKPYGQQGQGKLYETVGAGKSLAEFLAGGKRLLVIINDATRPTPTEAILSGIIPVIEKAGYNEAALLLLVATGAHRAPTDEEYRQILGKHYGKLRGCCVSHNARVDADMVDIGTTRNGTPIVLNKRLFEADRIIITGSVEPHYFAGFTGGRKAFLPGIAAYKSIEANHRLALSPRAKSLALEGNPVHEDMMDVIPLLKMPVFSVMTVLDKEQGVAEVTSGDLMASFYAAVEASRKIFCVTVKEKVDIVLSVAKFPMDIDLYQSQKAIDNGALALKDGGALILVSSCRDGIGDEAYAKLLADSSSPAEAIDRISAGYRLGYHKAMKIAEVSARVKITAVCEIGEERLKSMFIGKAPTPQEALDKAIAEAEAKGIDVPKVLVLTDGCVTVPVVQSFQ